jgi:hypothetical protein
VDLPRSVRSWRNPRQASVDSVAPRPKAEEDRLAVDVDAPVASTGSALAVGCILKKLPST